MHIKIFRAFSWVFLGMGTVYCFVLMSEWAGSPIPTVWPLVFALSGFLIGLFLWAVIRIFTDMLVEMRLLREASERLDRNTTPLEVVVDSRGMRMAAGAKNRTTASKN